MERYYTREEVKRLIKEVTIDELKRKWIGGIPNSCVMATIQHATGFPDHHIISVYHHQRKYPIGLHRWQPGVPPHGNIAHEVLHHLGWKARRIPTHHLVRTEINKKTGETRHIPINTAGEIAKRHPGGNFMASTQFHTPEGTILHTFNIKHGKVHDREGAANERSPVVGLYHLSRKK